MLDLVFHHRLPVTEMPRDEARDASIGVFRLVVRSTRGMVRTNAVSLCVYDGKNLSGSSAGHQLYGDLTRC